MNERLDDMTLDGMLLDVRVSPKKKITASVCMDFYGASSLKEQSAGRHIAPLGHIILIPGQSVFALSR
jgi:hypothetical protein